MQKFASKMHEPGTVHLLVDWCSFTISRFDFFSKDANEQYIFQRVLSKFGLTSLTWTEFHGRNGYNTGYYSDGISICFGGRDDLWIEFSGTGCRAWESCNPSSNWEDFIFKMLSCYPSLHFARLDIACDTFELLSGKLLAKYTWAGKYISRWRKPHCDVGVGICVVYFGSNKSDFMLRIYDKTLERLARGVEQDVPSGWIRLEFQLRNKAAQSFLRSWKETGDISVTFFGILRNQLMFVSEVPDRENRNQGRAHVVRWWSKLLANAGRIPMAYCGGMEYNLDSLQRYVLGQSGSSIRTYIEAFGSDRLLEQVADRPLNDRQAKLLEKLRDQMAAAPAPALPVKYSCSVCGFSGFESDFVIYGSDSECVCRSCAHSGRMDRQQLLAKLRVEALRGAEHTDLF